MSLKRRGAGPLQGSAGLSLIELLIAIFFTIIIVVGLSLTFPHANRSISHNRQEWIANNLANSEIEQVKSQTYDLLDPSDVTLFNASNSSCNCQTDDFSAFLSSNSVLNGVTFRLFTCVNYIARGGGNAWTAQCPAGGDTGYKSILVRVIWTEGPHTYSTSEEYLKTSF